VNIGPPARYAARNAGSWAHRAWDEDAERREPLRDPLPRAGRQAARDAGQAHRHVPRTPGAPGRRRHLPAGVVAPSTRSS